VAWRGAIGAPLSHSLPTGITRVWLRRAGRRAHHRDSHGSTRGGCDTLPIIRSAPFSPLSWSQRSTRLFLGALLVSAAAPLLAACADEEPLGAGGASAGGFGAAASAGETGGGGTAAGAPPPPAHGGEAGVAGVSGSAGVAGGSAAAPGGGAGGMAGGAAGTESEGGNGGTSAGGSFGGGGAGGSSSNLPNECGEVPFLGTCEGDTLRFCERSHYEGDAALPARVVSRACGEHAVCAWREGTAFCAPASACPPNQAACAPDGALARCDESGAGFALDACDPGARCLDVGAAASCSAPAQGSDVLVGCVTYEHRSLTLQSFGPIEVVPAPYLEVTVYEEDADTVLGRARLDERGCFEAALDARPSAAAVVHLTARVPRSEEGHDLADESPLLAVAHASSAPLPDGAATTGYWEWSNRDTGCGPDSLVERAVVLDADGPGRHRLGLADHDPATAPGPDWLIREACGSGAIHILRRTREALARVTRNHLHFGSGKDEIVRRTESLHALSVLALWEPGVEHACGSCTSATSSGPFLVPVGEAGTDSYELAIWLGGSNATPTQWASSVLTHEMGHWAMASYSRAPGEGGVHFAGSPSKPGLAYLEGWATAFGQWALSKPAAGEWDPVYVDRQDDTTFFLNIDAMTWSNGTLPTPAPGSPVDGLINENAVAGMIFALGAPATAVAHGQGLGPEAWFGALTSPRLLGSLGRGYFRTDLLDFFDAGRCSGAFPDAAITAVATPSHFAWDHDPLCEP
jgi:hypothetical protein